LATLTASAFPLVRSEHDILGLALAVTARNGDPDPELIQHATGTTEAAIKTSGSWVRRDEPSYLIAVRGSFTTRRAPGPPRLRLDDAEDDMVSFPVQVLVVEIKRGRVTDSGSDFEYPDLASVGPVVTDRRGSS
jgi:hypothetical protein